jgi:hypothetical protein
MKKLLEWGRPLAALVAILFVCILLVRQQTSPLVALTQWIGDTFEGFTNNSPKTSPRCPTGFTFYTDATGESLCCGGTVNQITHTCTLTSAQRNSLPNQGLCAFRPGVPDPNNPSTLLASCSNVVDAIAQDKSNTLCPSSLPVYAVKSVTSAATATTVATTVLQESCCKTATNLDGTDCIAADLESKKFCRVNPSTTFPGPKCLPLRQYDSESCPQGLQKSMYKLGSAEVAVYPDASGTSVPLCMSVEHSCFPDTVVKTLQDNNVFTSQPSDPRRWAFACSGYTKYYGPSPDRSDAQFQTGYLTATNPGPLPGPLPTPLG